MGARLGDFGATRTGQLHVTANSMRFRRAYTRAAVPSCRLPSLTPALHMPQNEISLPTPILNAS